MLNMKQSFKIRLENLKSGLLFNLCDQVPPLSHDHLSGSQASQRASVQPEDRLRDHRQDYRLRHRSVLLQHGSEELRGHTRLDTSSNLIHPYYISRLSPY